MRVEMRVVIVFVKIKTNRAGLASQAQYQYRGVTVRLQDVPVIEREYGEVWIFKMLDGCRVVRAKESLR
jgi:hypothetical protein